jgi:benzoate-CoA ligase
MVVCQETYAKQVLGIRESDRVYSAAKLFFAYGLGNAGYFDGRGGAERALPAPSHPDSVFEMLRPSRATIFFGIPTLYASMLATKDADQRYDLPACACACRPEALPDELYKRWRERYGVEIIDGIGTTEICHIFISEPPGSATAARRAAGAGLRGDRRGRRRRLVRRARSATCA